MIAAGIGCRRDCPAEAIVLLVRQAAAAHRIDALAVPAFKQAEPGLRQAAAILRLPLRWVADVDLHAAQLLCATHSDAVLHATGLSSVAEAAALALAGPPLLLPRFGGGLATCAVAGVAQP